MTDKSLPGHWFFAVLLCLYILNPPLFAQAPPGDLPAGEVYTRITTSRVHKYKTVVSIMPVEGIGDADSIADLQRIRDVVIADLDFSLRFDMLNRRIDELSIAPLNSVKGAVDFTGWQAAGAEYLVAGSFFALDMNINAEIRVYDLGLEDLVFLKNYNVDLNQNRRMAHRISEDIVLNVTGDRGVASTLIAFIRGTSSQTSEVFVCDYDGYNLVQVTNDSSVSRLPSWNSYGTKIAYTSYLGNVDLYTVELETGITQVLQAAKGVDMAANWCRHNGFLAFSSGFSGNQEIYFLRPGEAKLRRLTFSYATDTEPSWSPNGEEITFWSDRAGNPHVFIMGADGLNVRRITFESRNTTPSWRPLPYGDKILMTSEIMGVFQIAIIDTNGDNFIQLTTEGENRHPSWSPDGLHIVFASSRRGGYGSFEVYTMDWDGNSQSPLSQTFRSGKEPSWSPFLQR